MDNDEFDEQPYKVGRMEGDKRRYWKNRPMAQTFADRGFEMFGTFVEHTAVAFEPDHGFVAVLYTRTPLPSAWDEGYEVKDMQVPVEPAKTPQDWHTPPKAKLPAAGTGASGAAPTRGATARVWAIADELNSGTPLTRADRGKVIDKCVAEGINKSTAATQWSKWAKDKGI